MKVIIYRNLNMGETITNFLVLLFTQVVLIFVIFFLFVVEIEFFSNFEDDKVLLLILILIINNIIWFSMAYFCLKAIKNAVSNFFTYEEYKINDGILYYEKNLKLLKKIFCFRKLEINLIDIDNISILPPKEVSCFLGGRGIPISEYIEYFKPYERIKIKLIDGKEYSVCNNVKELIFGNIDKNEEMIFQVIANNIKDFIFEEKENYRLQKELENLKEKYNLPLEERYNFILNKIIEEEKLYLYKGEEKVIVNAEEIAIKNLEILKDMNFEEVDFYIFYVNYLSKKEYEDKKVLVGYNGIDGKEVTMLKLKDDINEIRDSKSTFI